MRTYDLRDFHGFFNVKQESGDLSTDTQDWATFFSSSQTGCDILEFHRYDIKCLLFETCQAIVCGRVVGLLRTTLDRTAPPLPHDAHNTQVDFLRQLRLSVRQVHFASFGLRVTRGRVHHHLNL